MALDFVAGCIGGCVGVLVAQPFDTVKVRLQTQNAFQPKYRGMFHCFTTTIRQEKVAGLFRGVTSPLVGVAAINAVAFGVYKNTQKQFTDTDSARTHFYAGFVAGTAQAFIASPIEMIKTRLQVQTSLNSYGPLKCVTKIVQQGGFRALFRGLGSTILRDAPAFGVYFSSYDVLERYGLSPLTAGGLAGVLSWVVVYPVDVIKTRLQVDGMNGPKTYRGIWHCVRHSCHTEGISVLGRGLVPTILRAYPTNAAIFTTVAAVYKIASPQTMETVRHIEEDCIIDPYHQFLERVHDNSLIHL